ncbi:MAG: tetratricopeptide repeat protein, partial [Gemmataceae bacterium]|nr:tetratricopeptide repeat protein [Gemmataceae bacterium]
MADSSRSKLPRLTPEQRRAAAGQFERANQVLAKNDYDYAIPLLLNCCLLDPGNAIYRQALRQATKNKYGNNQRGQALAFLGNLKHNLQLKKARLAGDYLKVLEHGEQILIRNPWHVATHLAMAEAFHELDLNDLAIWTLEQARQVDPNHVEVNRYLARLYEQRGNFAQAIVLWQLVRKADPTDTEAAHKAKDIAASATIAKGRYQEAVQGVAPTPLAQHEAATQATIDTAPHQPLPASEHPREDRVREAPALLAKIKANPANPLGYLHLAQLYRRADL